MSKSYDISSKSDICKFFKDIESEIMDEAKRSVLEEGIDYACPKCEREFKAVHGSNVCPYCGYVFELNINVTIDK